MSEREKNGVPILTGRQTPILVQIAFSEVVCREVLGLAVDMLRFHAFFPVTRVGENGCCGCEPPGYGGGTTLAFACMRHSLAFFHV